MNRPFTPPLSQPENRRLLVSLLFLAICIPSGGALLAKVWGLASMRSAFLLTALPCGALLMYKSIWSQNQATRETLRMGCFAGLVATFAYDIVRIPFHLGGLRVFDPINIYGMWITDAAASSWLTNAIGWSYHFYNGITFGIMYALFFKGRSIGWAILWGMALETIAILSPLGPIFGVYGNSPVIAIAYLGHIAYGIPLGYLIKNWKIGYEWLSRIDPYLRRVPIGAMCLFLLVSILPIQPKMGSEQIGVPNLKISGEKLFPSYIRIEYKTPNITLSNPSDQSQVVTIKQLAESSMVEPSGQVSLQFPKPGIYQVYQNTDGQTQSSLVIVEPVESQY